MTRLLICALLSLLVLPPVAAQEAPAAGETGSATAAGGERSGARHQLYAYTFKHRRAEEAEALIRPLLSPDGRTFSQPRSNTVIVRDNLAAISRIMPVLRRFDRPVETVGVEVMIIRARRSAFSPIIVEDELPQPLLDQLRKLLPYSSYKVLASTVLSAQEGEAVTYELGEGFAVSFELGTVAEGRVKLEDFRVLRTHADQSRRQLLKSSLRLPVNRPWALGLALTEDATSALMVVLTPRLVGTEEK